MTCSVLYMDGNNKEITFVDGEKKISILNFNIHVF